MDPAPEHTTILQVPRPRSAASVLQLHMGHLPAMKNCPQYTGSTTYHFVLKVILKHHIFQSQIVPHLHTDLPQLPLSHYKKLAHFSYQQYFPHSQSRLSSCLCCSLTRCPFLIPSTIQSSRYPCQIQKREGWLRWVGLGCWVYMTNLDSASNSLIQK